MKPTVLGLYLALVITTPSLAAQLSSNAASKPDCSKPPRTCNKPVKWIGDQKECSCFACEYGKPSVYVVCTKDKETKSSLLRLQDESEQERWASAPLRTLKGTIKTEGDKTVFVSDKDQKSWEIINPEAVKGHEGHHVEVSAHVYADKNQIRLMSVKMMKPKSSM
jgi:hypothetical protein